MADKFNLQDYETVKVRKQKFYDKFPEGRIIVDCIEADDKHALFKCSVYRNVEEQKDDLPIATGYAMEFRGVGSFANKHAWVENCEESAVGRATDNAGFATNLKCSIEEIKKVQVAEASQDENNEKPVDKELARSNPYPANVYNVCPLCDGKMHLAKSGKTIYCENWKNKEKGEHPSYKFMNQPVVPKEIVDQGADAVRQWVNEQREQMDMDGDIPF